MKTQFKFLFALKILAGITFFGFLFGFVTMHLWNWLIPMLFHGPILTFWQAVGLIILSKILFGGFGGGHKGGWGRHHQGNCGGRHNNWKERMKERFENMTPEQKERFKNKCKGWYNFDEQTEEIKTTTEENK